MVKLIFRADFLTVVLGNDARTHCASFIVTIIAGEHDNGASNSMISREVWPWTKFNKTNFDVNYKSSYCQNKVEDLYHRVLLIKDIIQQFTISIFWFTLFLEILVAAGLKSYDDGLVLLVGLLIFIVAAIATLILTSIMDALMRLFMITFP